MARVAVLGTGLMGAPMARNLARAGHEVRAWNRTAERARALRDDGVDAYDEPAAAAAGADVVLTMLADADAVLEVAGAARLAEGQVWWQASTVGVEGIDRCVELAERTGAQLVDGPILGTRAPAETGELVVLAAGPDGALAACAPLFDAVGSRTLPVGETGKATRLKLALNAWVIVVVEGTAETIALARALGVDPALVTQALAGGPLDLPYFRLKARLMLEDEYPASFPVRLAAKDAGLVVEAAERHGADLAAARAVRDRLAQAAATGLSEEDVAAVYRLALSG